MFYTLTYVFYVDCSDRTSTEPGRGEGITLQGILGKVMSTDIKLSGFGCSLRGVSDLFTMTVRHQGIIWSGGEVLNYLFRQTNNGKSYSMTWYKWELTVTVWRDTSEYSQTLWVFTSWGLEGLFLVNVSPDFPPVDFSLTDFPPCVTPRQRSLFQLYPLFPWYKRHRCCRSWSICCLRFRQHLSISKCFYIVDNFVTSGFLINSISRVLSMTIPFWTVKESMWDSNISHCISSGIGEMVGMSGGVWDWSFNEEWGTSSSGRWTFIMNNR